MQVERCARCCEHPCQCSGSKSGQPTSALGKASLVLAIITTLVLGYLHFVKG